MTSTERVRTRDPARRQRILDAAAELVARRGFHSVSLADIGAASGIVGSGVYRHFDSKAAVVVAVLEGALNRLLQHTAAIIDDGDDAATTLRALVAGQITFALEDRRPLQLYQREVHTLPEPDQRRLRRLQRLYVEEWVHALSEVRPDLSDTEARATVHACIGAIQSVISYDSGLPEDRLRARLGAIAHACLGVA